MNHLLKLLDLSKEEILGILNLADQLKYELGHGIRHPLLAGKTLGMIFQKASTRTRVSFETGIYQLGGYGLFLSSHDLQIGRGEPVEDTARVLSRYLDGIMIRTFAQSDVEQLAEFASVPVINGLTDYSHPCQVLADLMTIREFKSSFDGLKMCFIGDGNNMANSWIEAAMYFPFQLNMAIAPGYEPDQQLLALALQSGAKIFLTHDPKLAVDGANYNLIAELPTDVQFANENADLYRSMSNDFSAILKSLTFSKGVTRTEVTAPTQTSGSGS